MQTRKELSPDTEVIGTLILDILVFQSIRNKCLLFRPHSLWLFCYSSLWTKASRVSWFGNGGEQEAVCNYKMWSG